MTFACSGAARAVGSRTASAASQTEEKRRGGVPASPENHQSSENHFVTHERQSKIWRCDNHDYFAPCIYEITVNLEDWRSAALGRIVVDSRDNLGAPFSAHCELSEMGKAVADCWESIPRFYPQIKIIGKQVMPEHFHGLLWKEGFQDTILWREGQLENMIAYLQANPIRRALKAANPQLFHQVIDLEVDGLHFSALGNRHLLDRPLVQVQCSRRDFAYERVSDAGGGMKIAKDADGEPRVAFSSATFEDRLASLLAVAWPYTAAKKEMTRFDAVAMNRLCQWLAREGAAEINYRGMRPADIDALARASAKATTSLAPFDAEQNTLRCRIGRC